MKDILKKAGEKLWGSILYFIGWFLWTLYDVVSDTIQGIIGFFVAAFFLYIAWGIRLAVIAIILYLICRGLGAH